MTDRVELRWTPRADETAAALLARLRETGTLLPLRLHALRRVPVPSGQRVVLDGSGVRVAVEDAETTRPWTAFTSWSDTSAAVVLVGPGVSLVLPDRAAPDGGTTLRDVVRRHLGPPLGERGSTRRRRLLAARLAVVLLLLAPLPVTLLRVHAEGGEWRLTPSQTPPRLTWRGATYVEEREGTQRPSNGYGVARTPGGGTILVPAGSDLGPPSGLFVVETGGGVSYYERVGS